MNVSTVTRAVSIGERKRKPMYNENPYIFNFCCFVLLVSAVLVLISEFV